MWAPSQKQSNFYCSWYLPKQHRQYICSANQFGTLLYLKWSTVMFLWSDKHVQSSLHTVLPSGVNIWTVEKQVISTTCIACATLGTTLLLRTSSYKLLLFTTKAGTMSQIQCLDRRDTNTLAQYGKHKRHVFGYYRYSCVTTFPMPPKQLVIVCVGY